jgi:nitroreductase/FMN reductase [NAD(P)H]
LPGLADSSERNDASAIDAPSGLAELLRIASHVSHRQWADRPVAPELTRLLAACALSAPSKSDLQQADIVEVRDPNRRQALARLLPTLPWFDSAPVVLVFCGNGRRFRRLFEQAGRPFTNEHLDGFFNPTVDASLVLMNYMRAASAAGLVHCPISLLRNRAADVAQVLELPAHVFPVAGLCLGYPSAARGIVPRLPLAETLHLDRFDDSGQDSRIADYDARRAEIEAAWGKQDALSWSASKLKQYESAQRADWGQFVRGQGFSLD